MRLSARMFLLLLLMCLCSSAVLAGDKTADKKSAREAAAEEPLNPEMEAVIDRFVERERELQNTLRNFKPRIEIYLQELKPEKEMGFVPDGDKYFIGRLDLREGIGFRSFVPEGGASRRMLSAITTLLTSQYVPRGFSHRILVDDEGFDRKHYQFQFVRREFLGDVRTMVFDVEPKPRSGGGRFVGRIWVEDQDYNVVRFNGHHGPRGLFGSYSHFDSWRTQMGPGLWLPSYIYIEEPGTRYLLRGDPPYKGQIRLWGYNLKNAGRQEEFTSIVVDAPTAIQASGEAVDARTPVESQRAWERQAEDNVLDRLEKAGLTAPESDVDKVLTTVVNNLQVTNNINVQPEVRARVLLTTPLESMTVGHTIVLSRGLVDVLPDEASLAMVLAHELAHIVLGHRLDTKWAFYDRMMFSDETTFRTLGFRREPHEEEAADKKAMEFLMNSPYKDKLANAGLFLRTVGARADKLPNLIRPHLGNRLAKDREVIRMLEVMRSAPQLELRNVDQISALPLGGRIRLDPWDNKIELVKAKPVPLLSAREKIPLEVAPFMLYLTRQGAATMAPAETNTGTPAGNAPARLTPVVANAPEAAPAPPKNGSDDRESPRKPAAPPTPQR